MIVSRLLNAWRILQPTHPIDDATHALKRAIRRLPAEGSLSRHEQHEVTSRLWQWAETVRPYLGRKVRG